MFEVACFSDDERQLYFSQAAVKRAVTPEIIEKDFWVVLDSVVTR